jgi:tetratricopeptide (TPR) repeat protein
MATPKRAETAYVRQHTMLWVAALALAVGFFAGVGLTIYKTGSATMPGIQAPGLAGPGAPNAGLSPEKAQMLAALEKEAVSKPDDVAIWTQLGDLYFDANQVDKAIGAYQKALAIDGSNADVWTDLGVMYRRKGQPKAAITAFDKAISIAPRHEVARFNKGIVLMHDLNDRDGAIKAWAELLKIDPNFTTPGGQPLAEMLTAFKQHTK